MSKGQGNEESRNVQSLGSKAEGLIFGQAPGNWGQEVRAMQDDSQRPAVNVQEKVRPITDLEAQGEV